MYSILGFIGILTAIVILVVSLITRKSKVFGMLLLIISFFLIILSGFEQSPDSNSKQGVVEEEDPLHLKGEMEISLSDNTVTATVLSNAIDGSIFEVIIMNNNFDTKADFIEINDGRIVKEFVLPDDWAVGHIAGSALLRFNLEEYPQPDHIREFYGDNGENLKGILVTEPVEGIIYGMITSNEIAYPDTETVQTLVNEQFTDAMKELIRASNGLILKFEPDGSWGIVRVYLSDDWYRIETYQKERFVESVGANVEYLVKNAGLVRKDGTVVVSFYDRYGKDLARQKLTGGYNILR